MEGGLQHYVYICTYVYFMLIDCLRVMEKKTNVVIKASASTDDTMHDEDVPIATPISVEFEVPSTEQGRV